MKNVTTPKIDASTLLLCEDEECSIALSDNTHKVVLFESVDELVDAIIEQEQFKHNNEEILTDCIEEFDIALDLLGTKEKVVEFILGNDINISEEVSNKLDCLYSLEHMYYTFVDYCISSGLYRKEIVDRLSDIEHADEYEFANYIDLEDIDTDTYNVCNVHDVGVACASINMEYNVPHDIFNFIMNADEKEYLDNLIKKATKYSQIITDKIFIKSRVIILDKIIEIVSKLKEV